MIKIEQKRIGNRPFYYLSEQVNIGSKFKKIQVYIGKIIPNNLFKFYSKLEVKEIELVINNISNIYQVDKKLDLEIYKDLEKARIKLKYIFALFSDSLIELFWRDFAIKFIFESNSIEGSRLSQTEVENIIKNRYIKKTLDRKEILEVENSIKAFEFIKNNKFTLNQNSIKALHQIIVSGLGVTYGYKKEDIVVNNKKTCSPKKVREEITKLLGWWKSEMKTKKNKFLLAIKFHQKFELIHPFSDGNGRAGRLILIWMLKKSNYGVILFRNKNRLKYFSALNSADEGRNNKLYRYCVNVYKETIKNMI
jgi:Fic family protein